MTTDPDSVTDIVPLLPQARPVTSPAAIRTIPNRTVASFLKLLDRTPQKDEAPAVRPGLRGLAVDRRYLFVQRL